MRVWLERRDLDPLMQDLANDVLGRLAAALGRLVDPGVAAALDPGLARLGLLAMVERLTAYLETSRGQLDRAAVVATLGRLVQGLTVPPGSGGNAPRPRPAPPRPPVSGGGPGSGRR